MQEAIKYNFICGNCGHKVLQNGYVNHCPNCLWSKHIDVTLIDGREEKCGGLLEPLETVKEWKEWVILHKCLHCHAMSRHKTHPNDNLVKVAELYRKG